MGEIIGAFSTAIIIGGAAFAFTFTRIDRGDWFGGGWESISPTLAASTVAAFLSAALVMWGML